MTEQADSKKDPTLDDQLTQLVSYLDGELDVGEVTQVEKNLIDDQAMRSHADILSKTWSLLDELDDVAVSETFTQQTMKTIATQSLPEQPAEPKNAVLHGLKKIIVRYKVLSAFLIGVLGGCAGLMAGSISQRQSLDSEGSDVAIDQLIIENIDMLPSAGLYEVVPDADTLRELQLTAALDQGETP